MLWELSVSEQRYRAVLEVGAGFPVTEVAGRYGVSRQSVHTWLLRYRQEGIAGWMTAATRSITIPGGFRPRSRKRSVSCGVPIRSGVRGGWCLRWPVVAMAPLLARRSTGR